MTSYNSKYHQSIPGKWVCALSGLCFSTFIVMYVVLCATRTNFNIIVLFSSLMLRMVDWLFYTIFYAILRTIAADEPVEMSITYALQSSWTVLVIITNIVVMMTGLIIAGNGYTITDRQLQIVLLATAVIPTGLSFAVIAIYYFGVFIEHCGRAIQKMIQCLYS